MALKHRNLKNNWSTTLQADAAAAATTLSILQAFLDKLTSPNPGTNEWYMLTLDDGVQAPEIVRCTGKGSGTATVVRAQEGTTAPTTWATGTKVEIRATAELLKPVGAMQHDTALATVVFGGTRAGQAITSAVQSVLIGDAAGFTLTSGGYTTAVGAYSLNAIATGANNTAVGAYSLAYIDGASTENSAVGVYAGSTAGTGVSRSTYLGAYTDNAVPGLSDVLCLGQGALAYTGNTAVIGSPSSRLTDVYIGGGQRDGSAAQVTLQASAGNGTNNPGGTLRLGGGKGTGTGAGGKVVMATAPAGATGAAENALTDRAEWDSAGLFWTYGGLKTGDPGLGAGTWKLGTVQAGAVSLDTANYVEVDIGGSIVKLLKAA